MSDKSKDALRPLFPGLQTRKLDMHAYNCDRPPLERRQLFFNAVIGTLPPVSEAPNLHACAHLYASDQMSLFVVVALLDIAPHVTSLASLSHTVIFHTAAPALSMFDEEGRERWFCQEVWTDRAEDGRGVHHSRIWNSEGRHIATTFQDGMMRLRCDPRELTALQNRLSPAKSKI